jgi:hypothetical protein
LPIDEHANEPAVQLPPDLVDQYKAAVNALQGWKNHVAFLRRQIEEKMGGAYAGMVGDRKVVTYRPVDTWAVSLLRKEHPELAQHFVKEVTREMFALQDFIRQHGDIAARYQSRSFRIVE